MRIHFRCGLVVVVALFSTLLVTGPPAGAVPVHGIAFGTSCGGPVPIGQKTKCHFGIANSLDADSLTITSLTEVVHAAAGDDFSGNVLALLDLEFHGGASCDAGQDLCTLPAGS